MYRSAISRFIRFLFFFFFRSKRFVVVWGKIWADRRNSNNNNWQRERGTHRSPGVIIPFLARAYKNKPFFVYLFIPSSVHLLAIDNEELFSLLRPSVSFNWTEGHCHRQPKLSLSRVYIAPGNNIRAKSRTNTTTTHSLSLSQFPSPSYVSIHPPLQARVFYNNFRKIKGQRCCAPTRL